MRRVTATTVTAASATIILCTVFYALHTYYAEQASTSLVDTNTERSVNELRSAVEEVELAGQKLKLETSLWRDFMPGSGTQHITGSSLMASVEVRTTDGKAIPRDIEVTAVWVINGDKIWKSSVEEVRQSGAVVRGGPKWEIGKAVDVVVLLRHQKGGLRLLRASNQRIEKTI